MAADAEADSPTLCRAQLLRQLLEARGGRAHRDAPEEMSSRCCCNLRTGRRVWTSDHIAISQFTTAAIAARETDLFEGVGR